MTLWNMEIPHLFMEQLLAHMHTMLRYGQDRVDPTGFLLHATGEAMQLEMGYSGELMVMPLILTDNITHSWIKHVWVTTQEHGINLQTDFTDVPPQWQGDIEIMWLFIQNGQKQPKLQILNQCRMYLQVFLVSDIVISSGTLIATSYWSPTSPAESSMDWSHTIQPSAMAWPTW